MEVLSRNHFLLAERKTYVNQDGREETIHRKSEEREISTENQSIK